MAKKDERANVKIKIETRNRLMEIRYRMGFKSLNETLVYLIENGVDNNGEFL
jgi:hypothetical protein